MKKITGSFVALLLLLLPALITFSALAQDQIGSIRGTVYLDVNENGLCSDEGEVRLGDIPLELVNDNLPDIIRLTTEPDGTFAHTTTDFGQWQVTVVPGAGWRVTSQQTRAVQLTDDNPDVAGIDFCIFEIEAGPTQTPTPPATLPESGAALSPTLLLAAAAGLALMILGAAILIWNK